MTSCKQGFFLRSCVALKILLQSSVLCGWGLCENTARVDLFVEIFAVQQQDVLVNEVSVGWMNMILETHKKKFKINNKRQTNNNKIELKSNCA